MNRVSRNVGLVRKAQVLIQDRPLFSAAGRRDSGEAAVAQCGGGHCACGGFGANKK